MFYHVQKYLLLSILNYFSGSYIGWYLVWNLWEKKKPSSCLLCLFHGWLYALWSCPPTSLFLTKKWCIFLHLLWENRRTTKEISFGSGTKALICIAQHYPEFAPLVIFHFRVITWNWLTVDFGQEYRSKPSANKQKCDRSEHWLLAFVLKQFLAPLNQAPSNSPGIPEIIVTMKSSNEYLDQEEVEGLKQGSRFGGPSQGFCR